MRTILLLAASLTAGQGIGVEPLVDMPLGNHLRNLGTTGGEGKFVEWAPGEGPAFAPAVRGVGVSFLASSRGQSRDRTKTGGEITIDVPGLGTLDTLTLSLWFKPVGPNAPARLLYLGPCWDLYVSGSAVAIKVRHDGKDHNRYPPRNQRVAVEGRWNFIALTLDREAGTSSLYHALLGDEPRLATTWDDIPAYDKGEATLEIGNLGGIRPFRGLIDQVRIHDTVLSLEEATELCRADARTDRSLTDYLATTPERAPVFDYGDVCLSSRGKRANSIETIEAFRATRLVWSYTADAAFIGACKEAGCRTLQAAINSLPGHDETEAHALDLDGNPVVAPWMVAFNREKPVWWGCHNRPRFMEVSLDRAKRSLDAGADAIQFDDWMMAVHASSWGGACFCNHCMAGFRDYLAERINDDELAAMGIADIDTFDYRRYLADNHGITTAEAYKAGRRKLPTDLHFEAFLRHSDHAFFVSLREAINEQAGRVVPFSINSTLVHPSQHRNFVAGVVDFFQGETWGFDLMPLTIASKAAEGMGKWQVFVPKPRDLGDARRGIAAAYALGQLMLVPWDMYMGSDATGIRPRYYGTTEDYGDLFEFVGDHRDLFDDHGNPALVGVIVDLDHYEGWKVERLCQQLYGAQVPFAFIPVGHTYDDFGIEPGRLQAFRAVIAATPVELLTDGDRAAIQAVADDIAVLSPKQATPDALAELSPFDVWGPDGIYLLPRVKRDPNTRTLVCHLLNRVDREGDEPLRYVSFMVRRDAWLGDKLTGATLHRPGEEALPLEVEILSDGARAIVPSLPIWAIAELTFE